MLQMIIDKWQIHEGMSRSPQCEEILYEIHGFTQDSGIC